MTSRTPWILFSSIEDNEPLLLRAETIDKIFVDGDGSGVQIVCGDAIHHVSNLLSDCLRCLPHRTVTVTGDDQPTTEHCSLCGAAWDIEVSGVLDICPSCGAEDTSTAGRNKE